MKTVKQIKSNEQIEADNLDRAIVEFIKEYNSIIDRGLYYALPTDKSKFVVNESVIIGNLEDCVIEEVFCHGFFYKIDYTSIGDRNHVNKYHCKGVWRFNSISKINNNTESLCNRDTDKTHYCNTILSDYINNWFSGNLISSDKYQREYCWLLEDKQLLIDSMIKKYDIGRFLIKDYYYTGSTESGDLQHYPYEIVDGKQRLSAICQFINNEFPLCNGLCYSDMTPLDRNNIKKYPILIGVVASDITDIDLVKLFIKINTTGKVMDKEHIDKLKKEYGI